MSETPCTEHEMLIQDNSRKISALETRADYKDKRIDELSDKMDKMEAKIDLINDNVNKIVQSSIKSDNQLELRLKAIETELALTKELAEQNRKDTNLKIAIISLIFVILTFYFNYLHLH